MAPIFDLCCGYFSDKQKTLFNGFPLSTMSSHACVRCGNQVYPDRLGEDWVPATHRAGIHMSDAPLQRS